MVRGLLLIQCSAVISGAGLPAVVAAPGLGQNAHAVIDSASENHKRDLKWIILPRPNDMRVSPNNRLDDRHRSFVAIHRIVIE